MKVFAGKRDLVNKLGEPDQLGDTHVTVDGKPLRLRLDLANHSPTGFEWGYSGSGPAQLALAICADLVGDKRALAVYMTVKSRLIARIDAAAWALSADLIEKVIAEAEAEEKIRSGMRAGDMAYAPVLDRERQGFAMGIAVRGEKGYHPFTRSPSFSTYDEARAACDVENERLGLTREEAALVVASTMGRTPRKARGAR